eukprot:4732091-Amphidinium_carterae.3
MSSKPSMTCWQSGSRQAALLKWRSQKCVMGHLHNSLHHPSSRGVVFGSQVGHAISFACAPQCNVKSAKSLPLRLTAQEQYRTGFVFSTW